MLDSSRVIYAIDKNRIVKGLEMAVESNYQKIENESSNVTIKIEEVDIKTVKDYYQKEILFFVRVVDILEAGTNI